MKCSVEEKVRYPSQVLRHEASLDRVDSWKSVVDVLRRTKKRLFARAWLGCNNSLLDPCRGNMKLRVS